MRFLQLPKDLCELVLFKLPGHMNNICRELRVIVFVSSVSFNRRYAKANPMSFFMLPHDLVDLVLRKLPNDCTW